MGHRVTMEAFIDGIMDSCTPILDLGGQIQSAAIKVLQFFFRGDTGNLQARLFPWNTWCRIRPDAVKSFQSSIHVISLTWTRVKIEKSCRKRPAESRWMFQHRLQIYGSYRLGKVIALSYDAIKRSLLLSHIFWDNIKHLICAAFMCTGCMQSTTNCSEAIIPKINQNVCRSQRSKLKWPHL